MFALCWRKKNLQSDNAEVVRLNSEAAIMGRMMLTMFAAVQRAYDPNRNVTAVMPEWVVSMVIRTSGGDGPLSISRIAREVGLPRANVRRSLMKLIRLGLVLKVGEGYVNNPDYIAKRAHDHKRAIEAIKIAVEALASL
jgi:predicted transcriptional regulator